MIMTVDELRQFVTTDKTDSVLQAMLEGLEAFIVQYTNNNFKNRSTGLIEYPKSIKIVVVDIISWKLRMEALNSADASGKPISSETISRHSVTYASDSSEADIDSRSGLPKKYTAILDLYKRARF